MRGLQKQLSIEHLESESKRVGPTPNRPIFDFGVEQVGW